MSSLKIKNSAAMSPAANSSGGHEAAFTARDFLLYAITVFSWSALWYALLKRYRVTLLSYVIKASVSALRSHWEVNSSMHPDGDKLVRKHYYNIGFAADTPNGLMVPVIKNVDSKGLIEISKELGELSAQARDGKLKSADM